MGPNERLPEPVRSTAQRLAEEITEGGALAIVLVGSHARGDAGPESDHDVLAVGPRSYPR